MGVEGLGRARGQPKMITIATAQSERSPEDWTNRGAPSGKEEVSLAGNLVARYSHI